MAERRGFRDPRHFFYQCGRFGSGETRKITAPSSSGSFVGGNESLSKKRGHGVVPDPILVPADRNLSINSRRF